MIAELYDGTRLEFPDNTAPDIVQRTVKRVTAERQTATRKQAGEMALEGTSFPERLAIGAGKTVATLGRGAAQLAGFGPDAQEVRETRERDAALNKGAAMLGQVLSYIPTMLIPGANTLGGATAIGAGIGALQESEDPLERGKNIAFGGASGAAGKVIGDRVAQKLSAKLVNKEYDLAAQASRNAPRDATLAASRDAGFVVPPAQAGTGLAGRALEGFAGKLTTAQQASAQNAEVGNRLARQALGMADDAPITPEALEAFRKAQGAAYDDVAKLSDFAADALEQLKQARFDASAHFKHYARSADPAALAKAREAAKEVKRLDAYLEQQAKHAGRPDLLPALHDARIAIAKSHDIERALNDATGGVSLQKLAAALDSGRPLSGELETAAKFAKAFPKAAQDVPRMGSLPGTSPLDYVSAGLYGLGGSTLSGDAGGWAAAAIPFMRPVVRNALLSRVGQNALIPQAAYQTPASARLLESLAWNPGLRAATPGVSAGGVPLLVQAFQQ